MGLGSINLINKYPNPVINKQFNIEVSINSNLEIFNLMGKLCKSYYIQKGVSTIDVSYLASGTYLIKVNNSIEKLIVN